MIVSSGAPLSASLVIKQHFWWANDIEYRYGDHERNKQVVHVVICEESWEEVDPAMAQIVTKRSKHAWLSSEALTRESVHERCNLGARHRGGIENSFLVEKRHGYQYEHCFSQNWNAMKGYHFDWLGHLDMEMPMLVLVACFLPGVGI